MNRFFLSFLLSSLLLCQTAHAQSAAPLQEVGVLEQVRALPPYQMDEVLWLARCLYSESNLPNEQRLVAWVVRNRVETGFRGNTYREVILEPQQFSAFNTPNLRRDRILELDQHTSTLAWQSTLRIALEVYSAPAFERPFGPTTRHFYSPISMEGNNPPSWAESVEPLDSEAFGVDAHRFQFFEQIDETLDPHVAEKPTPSARIAKRREALRARADRPRSSTPRFSGRVKRPARPSLMPPRKQ